MSNEIDASLICPMCGELGDHDHTDGFACCETCCSMWGASLHTEHGKHMHDWIGRMRAHAIKRELLLRPDQPASEGWMFLLPGFLSAMFVSPEVDALLASLSPEQLARIVDRKQPREDALRNLIACMASENLEPPAGPAFEEFATLAKLAKAIDEADRTNTLQDDWNLRLWRSTATPSVILRLLALAYTPIDLNATREEGWISVDKALPDMSEHNESKDSRGRIDHVFDASPFVMTYIPDGVHGTSSIQTRYMIQRRISYLDKDPQNWVHAGVTHWQPLPAPPAFVQGIGGKP